MSLMQLRRIRLINFHNFIDETLSVKTNLFLIGENQSGKTTVLDAIHVALTAGVDVELNAASRFGQRTEPGRSLSSIVLRYDHEKNQALRPPSISYVAAEIADEENNVSTFGIGAFATTLESQPEVWGFIARGKCLEELDLIVGCDEPSGSPGRPRDRAELEAVVGKQNVWDKGRYRTEIARYLFKDRAAYTLAMDLIAAAKAYRALVAKARNINELFVSLLPAPAEEEFEEVRSALRAIDGIHSSLAELQEELNVLRFVIQKLQEARKENERIARYEFVAAELHWKKQQLHNDELQSQLQDARRALSDALSSLETCRDRIDDLESLLRELRGSDDSTILNQEEHARMELETALQDEEACEHDLAQRRHDLAMRERERDQALDALNASKHQMHQAILSSTQATQDHLGEAGLSLAATLLQLVTDLVPAHPDALVQQIRTTHSSLKSAFLTEHTAADRAATLAHQESARLAEQARALRAQAEDTRRRAELLPDLEGYPDLIDWLSRNAPNSQPLYRLFELAPDASDSLGSAIECWLGARALGAVVPTADEYRSVKHRVLELRTGVEVLDPAQLGTPPMVKPGTLLQALIPVGNSDLSCTAASYLSEVAGDVRILNAGEPRAGVERGIWTDGYMFDRGAEFAVEPGPPSFFGAEARRRASELQSQRLTAEALKVEEQVEEQRQAAQRYDEIAAACSRCRDALEHNAPEPLFLQARSAERATAAAAEARILADQDEQRLHKAELKTGDCRRRHQELLAAISERGLIGLRQRIEELERELEDKRKQNDQLTRDEGRCQERVKEKERQLTDSRTVLERLESVRQRRRAELLSVAPPDPDVDVEDYLSRILQQNRAQLDNIPRYIQEARINRARAFENIKSSDGIYSPRVWHKFGFRVNEENHEIIDQSDNPIEMVFSEREAEVNGLSDSLNEKNRDLMERVIMAGLVKRLQLQLRDLRSMISGINTLTSDLWFGHSRFNFSQRARPDFQRLINLLNEQAILQDGRREELREFFMARIDTFKQSRDGEVPDILDYRRWFEFRLETRRGEGERAELGNDKLSFGSTGEQAVPRYLLIIALASLFYDRCAARLRLLLMDEAFLGIDQGRRESLLQFADRCKVCLIVATPELDGVTPSLAESTTLLVEKSLEGDVFVSDFHWRRQEQLSLFEPTDNGDEQNYVIGRPTGRTDEVDSHVIEAADLSMERGGQ